ncbi:MAG: polysaccharide biosynthesis C-terminal domain-containing protein [Hyphomicrobiaceae bacterium]
MIAIALAPLWPACGEAIARGDANGVRMALVRSVLLNLAFAGVLSVAMVVSAPMVIEWGVGTVVAPSALLLVAFGAWKVIEAGGNALSMYLNGARIERFQIVASVVTTVCAVIRKIVLIDQFGTSGVLWATSISYLACIVIPVYLMRKTLFHA